MIVKIIFSAFLVWLPSFFFAFLESLWELISIPIKGAKFQSLTLSVVKDIIRNCTTGLPTSTANVENTNKRFWACVSFFRDNGTIPSPIVVTRLGDGFKIADGNHRLAAIIHVGVTPDFEIPAWLAII